MYKQIDRSGLVPLMDQLQNGTLKDGSFGYITEGGSAFNLQTIIGKVPLSLLRIALDRGKIDVETSLAGDNTYIIGIDSRHQRGDITQQVIDKIVGICNSDPLRPNIIVRSSSTTK